MRSPKKSLWRDADNRHRPGIHPESTTNHQSIARVVTLPCLVAHDRSHGRARQIVGVCQQAPGARLQPKGANSHKILLAFGYPSV